MTTTVSRYEWRAGRWPEEFEPVDPIRYSPQAARVLEAEGWLDRGTLTPLVLRRWAYVWRKAGVKPARFLCQRMSGRQIVGAWRRAERAGVVLGRGPGSPYEDYQAALVAGAILTDDQLAWLGRMRSRHRGRSHWGCLMHCTARRISWPQLRSAWLFGTWRSKRHQQVLRLRKLTEATVAYCESDRSKQVAADCFWRDVVLLQRMGGMTRWRQRDLVTNAVFLLIDRPEMSLVDALVESGLAPLYALALAG